MEGRREEKGSSSGGSGYTITSAALSLPRSVGRTDGRRVGPGRRKKKGDHTGRTFSLSHMAWREGEKEGCLPGNEDFKRESGRI